MSVFFMYFGYSIELGDAWLLEAFGEVLIELLVELFFVGSYEVVQCLAYFVFGVFVCEFICRVVR